MNPTKHWHEHSKPTPECAAIALEDAETRDLKTVGGHGRLLFHILIGGLGMRSVRAGFRGDTQLRAEQAALAWCRSRWVKDRRDLYILSTEIVEQKGGGQ